jgi:uncharacterized small protein (DUF1192 family)
MKGDDEINFSSDILDSRDIEERINHLEGEIERIDEESREQWEKSVIASNDGNGPAYPYANFDNVDEFVKHVIENSDERLELKKLTDFRDEVGSGEWPYGLTFINADSFTEYAEQFAEDIGAINRDAAWPLNHINWEAAASDLKQDYSEVEIDGNSFYYLSC